MERSVWTDARIDDRFDQIDRRFDRIEHELVMLRTEMQAGFAEVRQAIFRTNLTLIAAMVGLLAAILARGA
jgi:hypothetical protein